MPNWGYTDDTLGPQEWPKHYTTGEHQSPIDIQVDLNELNYHQLNCDNCGLTQQLRDELSISTTNSKSNGGKKSNNLRVPGRAARAHLDSVGNDDDAFRSPSTSSAGSEDHRTPSPTRASDLLHQGQRRLKRHLVDLRHKLANAIDVEQHSTPVDHHNSEVKRTSDQNTRYCVTNHKIFLGYPRYLNAVDLCNTGHAWQINIPPELAAHTLLAGPPLGDREYRLAQLHCHWGEACEHGSEHRINGRSFSAEIHFVHWNCSQFSSMEEAAKHKHGLAVVGVLVQAVDGERNRNKHLDRIISRLPQIREANSSVRVTEFRLDLKKLMPANRWNYATYEGSLTTPPLSEVVDWIVFLQPIQCSTEQIEQFRQIKCPTGSDLAHNYRPCQPVNSRVVSIWSHSHTH